MTPTSDGGGASTVLDLLAQALEIPRRERAAWLAASCAGRPEVRREVEDLLALEDEADSFLAEPAVDPNRLLRAVEASAATEGEGPSPDDLPPGSRVGPYRIRVLLGRGGMGAVYRAVREDDFEKEVALKVVRREIAHPSVLRRFHRERQLLARLEHPSIAHLLDGGTTPDGRPYLVMEHVEGMPIDRYCAEHRLPAAQRLELARKVAEALAFAHQQLVVHLDLKPGNILVTAEGEPKLLDFGISRVVVDETESGDLTTRGLAPTREMMTPEYASPEQFKREPPTPASDLYSFGVLLYELLTGTLPGDIRGKSLAEVVHAVCDDEAARPSTVAAARARAGETPPGLPREPGKLRRLLAGDVDAIILKCLAKQPRERYASAEWLAADLRRHLLGLPVRARRSTFVYRAGKFARRNWIPLAAGAVLVLLLAAFFVRERVRFAAERERTVQITKMLRGLLNVADPDRRDHASVVAILEDTRTELAAMKADPDVQSELLATLGAIHMKLGDLDAARQAMVDSVVLWRRERPGDTEGLAQRLANLGALDLGRGELASAEDYLAEAVALRGDLAPGSVPAADETATLNNLATIRLYRGDFDGAETLYRRGLDIRRRELGPESEEVSKSLRSLSVVAFNRGDLEQAEGLAREALAIRVAAQGPEHTEVAAVLDLLGQIRLARGALADAESDFEQSLRLRRARLEDGHEKVARSRRYLAEARLARGDAASALDLARRAHADLTRQLGPEHWRSADAESVLGAALAASGRTAEGEALMKKAHRSLLEDRGPYAAVTRGAERRLEGEGRAQRPPAPDAEARERSRDASSSPLP